MLANAKLHPDFHFIQVKSVRL